MLVARAGISQSTESAQRRRAWPVRPAERPIGKRNGTRDGMGCATRVAAKVEPNSVGTDDRPALAAHGDTTLYVGIMRRRRRQGRIAAADADLAERRAGIQRKRGAKQRLERNRIGGDKS